MPLQIEPNQMDFAEVELGRTAHAVVTIRSRRNTHVEYTVEVARGLNARSFHYAWPPGPRNLGPGERVRLDVIFQPTRIGLCQVELCFMVDGRAAAVVSLVGCGVPPERMAVIEAGVPLTEAGTTGDSHLYVVVSSNAFLSALFANGHEVRAVWAVPTGTKGKRVGSGYELWPGQVLVPPSATLANRRDAVLTAFYLQRLNLTWARYVHTNIVDPAFERRLDDALVHGLWNPVPHRCESSHCVTERVLRALPSRWWAEVQRRGLRLPNEGELIRISLDNEQDTSSVYLVVSPPAVMHVLWRMYENNTYALVVPAMFAESEDATTFFAVRYEPTSGAPLYLLSFAFALLNIRGFRGTGEQVDPSTLNLVRQQIGEIVGIESDAPTTP